MNASIYERLTKEIVDEVMKASPNLQGANRGHGPRNRIEGASGFKHQIDVSIEIAGGKIVLVECKCYKSLVTVSDMLILVARIDDIRKKRNEQVSGCFFTTKGYTKPAEQVGIFYGIELNTFSDVSAFAVHVARNTFIKSPPAKFAMKVSGYAQTENV